jgi:hypothetical protein
MPILRHYSGICNNLYQLNVGNVNCAPVVSARMVNSEKDLPQGSPKHEPCETTTTPPCLLSVSHFDMYTKGTKIYSNCRHGSVKHEIQTLVYVLNMIGTGQAVQC